MACCCCPSDSTGVLLWSLRQFCAQRAAAGLCGGGLRALNLQPRCPRHPTCSMSPFNIPTTYKLQVAPSWYSEYLLFSTGCHHSTTVHHFIFLAHIPNSEVYDCLVSSSGKQIDTNWRRKEGPNEAICAKGGSSWHVSNVSNEETVSTLSENRTWPLSNVSPQLQDVHHV